MTFQHRRAFGAREVANETKSTRSGSRILRHLCPLLSAPNAKASFESLKALAGQWDAKDPSGKQQTITWKVVSGGSVVMESCRRRAW